MLGDHPLGKHEKTVQKNKQKHIAVRVARGLGCARLVSQWTPPDPRADAFLSLNGGDTVEEAKWSLYIKEHDRG